MVSVLYLHQMIVYQALNQNLVTQCQHQNQSALCNIHQTLVNIFYTSLKAASIIKVTNTAYKQKARLKSEEKARPEKAEA